MREDFRDVLAELVRSDARFLVVGAHALGALGVPRATVDLDVWIEPTIDNAHRAWNALAAFGAPLDALGIAEADLARPDIVAQFGGRDCFIRNKRASGRHKDLGDIEALGERADG